MLTKIISGVLLSCCCLFNGFYYCNAAEYKYTWSGDKGENVNAEIAPFKFGKKWAYCIEHDDGHDFALSVSLPLFSKYHFTDAPAQLPGKGKPMPLVGTVAINPVSIDSGNDTTLKWQELRQLSNKGWGVVNHSYWHTGIHWDPSKMNSPEQFRHEIYWGQMMISYFVFDNKKSTSGFVFPNGDYNYKKYLSKYGMSYGSLCNRPFATLMDNGKVAHMPIVGRTNLDENIWSKNPDPMYRFPEKNKLPRLLFVDFTHIINGDRNSENYKRWEKRISTIEKEYGAKGKDEFWCAPTYKVIDYFNARKNAKIELKQSEFTVSIPDSQRASALTIKLTNVSKNSTFPVPQGGCVYRTDSTVWITLPEIGRFDKDVLEPKLDLLYKGDFKKSITLKSPAKIYAVRLLQTTKVQSFPEVTLITADSQKKNIEYNDLQKFVGKKHYGKWFLIPVMPNHKPILAKALEVNGDSKHFRSIEVWGVK